MTKAKRHDNRRPNQLRPVTITPGFVRKADGSCLIEIGNTRVICTASFAQGVPRWREESQLGWVTAEYGMLPASTGRRKSRPGLKPDSRGIEIQRLIGRVLRNVIRFDKLGPNTVNLDCDVLEADGGTRTASITGAYVAMALAVHKAACQGLCKHSAIISPVAAVSVGIVNGQPVLDLDYHEDSSAEVDMNIAMRTGGKYVEIQGTSEGLPFDAPQLQDMLTLASKGISKLFAFQRIAIKEGKQL